MFLALLEHRMRRSVWHSLGSKYFAPQHHNILYGGLYMPYSHKAVLTANAFSIGILIPVLTLIFCKHGASVETLWVVMGVYSVAVMILEIPSGIIADLIGRKKIFIFSHVLSLISFFLIFKSKDLSLLLIAVIFLGAGRAFSSGSIEALEIDRFIEQKGLENLSTMNNVLTAIECIGTFFGAILGGYIGYIDNTYSAILILLMIVESLISIFSIFVFQEDIVLKKFSVSEMIKNMRLMISEFRHTRSLWRILFMSFTLGISLSTIETYWQPTIVRYLPAKLNWILGMISCFVYIGVGIGSCVGKYLLNYVDCERCTQKDIYYFTRILLPISLFLIFFSRHWIFFVFAYSIIYIILGLGNLIENTILHSVITNKYRASILSFLSLVTKGGGVVASIVGMIVVTYTEIDVIWIISPMFVIFIIVCIILFLK